MVLYAFITALTVFLAYFINSSRAVRWDNGFRGAGNPCVKTRQELLNRVLLAAIFVVLFALSALRVGMGNDYWVYRYDFLHIINKDQPVSFEIGFKILIIFLEGLFGYDNYRFVFAFIAFFTCVFFVKGLYDNADWFVMTFFLFMANGFYFMSFSNVRYYFVMALCLYAMKFLFERRFLKFILWIAFAAFFHKSVLLVIPVYVSAYFLKWNKKNIWLLPAVCAALFFGRELVRKLVFAFYPFYEGDLILDVANISYINVLKCLAVLVFSLLYYKKAVAGNPRMETFFNLNLFALVIYSFGYYIPVVSRVCYYMILGQIFLVPGVLLAVEDRKQKRFFLCAIVAAYLIYLVFFWIKSREPGILLLPYMSWLFP